MKQRLKENLSPATKLRLRRWLVGSVELAVRAAAAGYRMGRRVLDTAVVHGLDLQRAWDVPRPPRADAAPAEPYGARDFLFLLEALEGGRAPRAAGDVRVSVIIPVFNKVEFTFQCLRSLLREVDFDDTEIIVVDNASTDETAELLARFRDFVRVIRNDENQGFVGACNRAAGEARGRYLVFLNNDAVVEPGWLEELTGTAERDERVGAVGSLLLHPDGRVQEAGGIVWRDASAEHYGRGRSPGDRRLSFARDVDFCSGASLLVRRELFEQLGGFDRRYAPAYYEDVDLCFGVRALGRRVVYQPLSRVRHYEGATAGRDTSSGFKRFQPVNREKFRAKWREVLEREHYERAPANVERAATHGDAPRFIVFDDRVPAPDRDAGGARMGFILRTLARRGRAVFVSLGKSRPLEYERLLWRDGVETASAVDALRLLGERRFEAAILSRPAVAEAVLPSIRAAAPGVKIVFDTVDAHFVRLEREARATGDAAAAEAARRSRELEARIVRASDLVWCTSEEDRAALERASGSFPAAIVPTVHAAAGAGLPFAERRDLLFVGNFVHTPNQDAVHFFVREVMPLLRDALPGARLLVVGDNVPEAVAAYASADVWVLGFVPDLKPLLAGSRVMVAPLRFGAGVKGKVGESLANGLPVVTTTVGAEGMKLADGEHALVADSPADFAAAVARAYSDAGLWQRLSDGGRAHVAATFSPEVVGRAVDDSLRALAGSPAELI